MYMYVENEPLSTSLLTINHHYHYNFLKMGGTLLTCAGLLCATGLKKPSNKKVELVINIIIQISKPSFK